MMASVNLAQIVRYNAILLVNLLVNFPAMPHAQKLQSMETTFKIILDKRHPKKDFTIPLRLRIFQNRVYKEYTLGISIMETDWNEPLQEVEKSNPSHGIYNAQIASIKAKVRKAILFNEDEDNIVTPEEIIKHISRKQQKKAILEKPDILLFGKQHIAKLEAEGRIGNSIVYSCAVNKLKGYANKDSLPFEDVNYSFIERFNTALLAEGMKVNAISNYMRTIRALFNRAIREDIISANSYPFSKFKIKNERTINRTLTIAEMVSIATHDLPVNSTIWHHRNLFMLSFCLIGMNFSDLLTLTPENFIDGRIVFRRRKTHKVYSILLQPQVQDILNNYLRLRTCCPKDYILPFIANKNNPLELKKDVLQAIKNTNDYLGKLANLCEIKKPVTTYYARYTWANVARSLGYSKDLIAEALGHDYGNAVTGIYLDNYGAEIIDGINAKVIEAAFGIK